MGGTGSSISRIVVYGFGDGLRESLPDWFGQNGFGRARVHTNTGQQKLLGRFKHPKLQLYVLYVLRCLQR